MCWEHSGNQDQGLALKELTLCRAVFFKVWFPGTTGYSSISLLGIVRNANPQAPAQTY